MENEIKVGEYIRENKGFIFKVVRVEFDEEANQNYYKGEDLCSGCFQEMIKTHSPNLIDLIECGDYVNGKRIDGIIDNFIGIDGADERVLCFETDFPIEKGLRAYHDKDIQTIVTKEMMESISYKVKE